MGAFICDSEADAVASVIAVYGGRSRGGEKPQAKNRRTNDRIKQRW